jgi:hypothetical protein
MKSTNIAHRWAPIVDPAAIDYVLCQTNSLFAISDFFLTPSSDVAKIGSLLNTVTSIT